MILQFPDQKAAAKEEARRAILGLPREMEIKPLTLRKPSGSARRPHQFRKAQLLLSATGPSQSPAQSALA